MPNGNERKEYGPHKYEDEDRTSDCIYRCGCWMGNSNSGGPCGIDPFGACPGNPEDGKLLGGDLDKEKVIEQRIHDLIQRAEVAEQNYANVSPGTQALATKLRRVESELLTARATISRIRESLNRRSRHMNEKIRNTK